MNPNNPEDNARFRNMMVINQDLLKDLIFYDGSILSLKHEIEPLINDFYERQRIRGIKIES